MQSVFITTEVLANYKLLFFVDYKFTVYWWVG